MTFALYIIGSVLAAVIIWRLAVLVGLWSERRHIWSTLDVQLGIPKNVARLPLRVWKWNFGVRRTPQGARVWGNVQLPDEFLRLADVGIEKQITCILERFPEWKKFTRVSDYFILAIDPMAINQVNDPGSPALILRGSIQTAGTVLGVQSGIFPPADWDGTTNLAETIDITKGCPGTSVSRPYLVIPHQAPMAWAHQTYWRDANRNEGEHAFEAVNDTRVFVSKLGEHDIHPHFPCPSEAAKESVESRGSGGSIESSESIESKELGACL